MQQPDGGTCISDDRCRSNMEVVQICFETNQSTREHFGNTSRSQSTNTVIPNRVGQMRTIVLIFTWRAGDSVWDWRDEYKEWLTLDCKYDAWIILLILANNIFRNILSFALLHYGSKQTDERFQNQSTYTKMKSWWDDLMISVTHWITDTHCISHIIMAKACGNTQFIHGLNKQKMRSVFANTLYLGSVWN